MRACKWRLRIKSEVSHLGGEITADRRSAESAEEGLTRRA